MNFKKGRRSSNKKQSDLLLTLMASFLERFEFFFPGSLCDVLALTLPSLYCRMHGSWVTMGCPCFDIALPLLPNAWFLET